MRKYIFILDNISTNFNHKPLKHHSKKSPKLPQIFSNTKIPTFEPTPPKNITSNRTVALPYRRSARLVGLMEARPV